MQSVTLVTRYYFGTPIAYLESSQEAFKITVYISTMNNQVNTYWQKLHTFLFFFFFVHFVYEILLLQDFTLALSEMRLERISAYKEAAG